MKTFLLGAVVGVLLFVVAGFAFVFLGGMPVATKGEPLPFEKRIARMALRAAVGNAAEKTAPFEASEAHLLAGAETYERNCAVCHGLPGQDATAISKGLYPRPPRFFEPHPGRGDAPPVGKTYWKVKNGIRLTGMPGFEENLTEQELWEVSLLLSHAAKLPPAVTKELSSD